MTQGEKVQATGDTLYLGVIKQKGNKGFYKITVSKQFGLALSIMHGQLRRKPTRLFCS